MDRQRFVPSRFEMSGNVWTKEQFQTLLDRSQPVCEAHVTVQRECKSHPGGSAVDRGDDRFLDCPWQQEAPGVLFREHLITTSHVNERC